MKIIFVSPAFFGSGGIDVIYEYSRRLTDLGNEVKIYVPLIAYNLHNRTPIINCLRQVYGTIKNLKLIIVNQIIKQLLIKENVRVKVVPFISNIFVDDADVVIATARCTAYDVVKLNNEKGKKFYFIQGYEIWDNEYLGKQSYKLPLIKITIANWIKNILIEQCGCINEEIYVINNGIDTKTFIPAEKKSKDKNIYCLMLDHHLEIKGVKYGVEAFKIAKKQIPYLELIMFGMKKSKYVESDITYYENPSKETIVSLYQKSDIFIYPSIVEGWGLTPIEAMACKCAVVGTNTGCMLDIGQNNKNVIICEKENPDDLAKGILKLSIDNNFRKRISENGYDSIRKLDRNISAKKFQEVLNLK